MIYLKSIFYFILAGLLEIGGGGVFIILAMLWGWKVDGIKPDKYDLIGAMLALFGVIVMMYWPRDS